MIPKELIKRFEEIEKQNNSRTTKDSSKAT